MYSVCGHKINICLLVLMQARVEHLLMQNKELLSHLQKLMSQLAQIQTFQQSLAQQQQQTAPIAPPPPQNTSDNSPTSSQEVLLPTLAGDPASKPTSPPLTESPLTSTPTKQTADEAVSPSNMSLGIDFNTLSGSATNDPFQPQGDASS